MFTVPPKYHKTSTIYIVLLNIVVLGATLTLFITTRKNDTLTIQENFQNESSLFIQYLEQQFNEHNLVLQNFQTHLNGSEDVTSESLADFVARQERNEFDTWSFGWISAEGSASGLATERWNSDTQQWVTQTDATVYPVSYQFSADGVTHALGRDLNSHPDIQQAMNFSLQLRESIAIANPAPFSNEGFTGEVLLLQPIWAPGEPGQEIDGNTDQLLGFAVGILDVNKLLIDGIQSQNFRDISIEINDLTSLINSDTVISSTSSRVTTEDSPIPAYIDRFKFGNNDWQVKIAPGTNYLESRRGILPWTLLLSGVLVTILVNGLTWFIVFETVAVREQVIERTEALNSTNELLWNSTNELNKTKTALKMQAIEKEKVARDLEETQTQLDQAGTGLNTDLLENMTKEIRVPMNGVLGLADMLNETELDREQLGFVQTIKANGHNLLSTMNDILDFSKMESGEMPIVLAPFKLRRTLEESLEYVAFMAHEKGIELILDLDESVPEWIDSDERRVSQIVTNLLNNAVSHTDSGNIQVSVSAARIDRQLEIFFVIQDEGIGIPAENIDSIFELPDPKAKSLRDRFLTAGFSLGVSKKLAQFLGGDISVDSVLGIGSTFTFTILANEADPIVTNDIELEINNLKDKAGLIIYTNHGGRQLLNKYLSSWGIYTDSTTTTVDGLKLFQLDPDKYDFILLDTNPRNIDLPQFMRHIKSIKTQLPPIFAFTTLNNMLDLKQLEIPEIIEWIYKPLKRTPLYNILSDYFLQVEYAPKDNFELLRNFDAKFAKEHPLEILIAEDNPINQKVAITTLTKLGYSVDFVSNGLEAMDRVVRKKYDLVFMDIHMPRMSGINAIKGIKRSVNRNLREKPIVIAMTNEVRQQDKEDCILAGANGFILKPFRVSHLVRVIKDVHAFKRGDLTLNAGPTRTVSIAKTGRLQPSMVEA